MDIPDPVLIGFFPKHTAKRPAFVENENALEICSVSECVSKGPENWVDWWKHNALGFYDSQELALACAGESASAFDLYAYTLFPLVFLDGAVSDFEIPIQIEFDLSLFQFLGLDAVSRSAESPYFECSALSCNNGAQHFNVNEYCLFSDRSEAYHATLEISKGQYEPGLWYLMEVYRKRDEL